MDRDGTPASPSEESEHERLSLAVLEAALSHWLANSGPTELRELLQRRHLLARSVRSHLEAIDAHSEGLEDLLAVRTFLDTTGHKLEVQLIDRAAQSPIASHDFARYYARLQELTEQHRAGQVGDILQAIGHDALSGKLKNRAEIFDQIDALRAKAEADAPLDRGEAPPVPTFPVYSFGDPDNERKLDLPNPLIPGALFPGLTVLYGKWKRAKKTQYAVGLSYALQAGLPFLGREVAPKRVLWIQRDMPEGLFLKYTNLIRLGAGLQPLRIPYIADPVNLNLAEDRNKLLATLAEHKTEVLFIDSSRGVSNIDEDSSGEVAALVRGYLIDQIRDGLKINVVLIAHPGKSNSGIRGSGDWEAASDSLQGFKPHFPNGQEHPDYVEIAAFGRHEDFTISFAVEYSNEGWIFREVSNEEKDSPERESQFARFERLAPSVGGWHSSTIWGEKCKVRDKDRRDVVAHFHARGLMENNGLPFPLSKYRWLGRPLGTPPAGVLSASASGSPRDPGSTGSTSNTLTGECFPEAPEAPEALPEQDTKHSQANDDRFVVSEFDRIRKPDDDECPF